MRPTESSARSVRFLVVGYNGANNTGSEARLLAIIDDLRRTWGNSACITILSLNAANLRRYLDEDETLEIVECPMIFFHTVRREVRKADAVLLVEGSCFMDTWAAPLLWFFLWAARSAAREGKPCLAYAVDAGQMSRLNAWLTLRAVREARLVMRTPQAVERMRALGVEKPIECTGDTAFYLDDSGAAAGRETLASLGLDPDRVTVGMSLVDFSIWPVVARPWAPRSRCYRWPYYFSDSAARRRSAAAMVEGYATLVGRLLRKHDANVLLIAMEELDERFLARVRERLTDGRRVAMASAGALDAATMTRLLRCLSLLITSRYHASVLSLKMGVPQFAIGHDLRLETLYQELGLFPDFFVSPTDPGLWDRANALSDSLLQDASEQRTALEAGHSLQLARALRNREMLARIRVRGTTRPVPSTAVSPVARKAEGLAHLRH